MKKYQRSLIFETADPFGPIEVVENKKFRSLHFGTNSKQSEMFLQDPYLLTMEHTQLMAMSLIFQPSPRSVLILGLGGGSFPKFLWKYFPQVHCDLIERSRTVIDLCFRYFALPKSKRLTIYEADALDFVKNCKSNYDLIFIDLFQEEGVSTLVAKEDFFLSCLKRLKNKNSILVWNTWSFAPKPLMLSGLKQICEQFGKNLLILPDQHEESLIFFLFLQFPNLSLYQLTQRAKRLEKKTGLPCFQILSNLNFFDAN